MSGDPKEIIDGLAQEAQDLGIYGPSPVLIGPSTPEAWEQARADRHQLEDRCQHDLQEDWQVTCLRCLDERVGYLLDALAVKDARIAKLEAATKD